MFTLFTIFTAGLVGGIALLPVALDLVVFAWIVKLIIHIFKK